MNIVAGQVCQRSIFNVTGALLNDLQDSRTRVISRKRACLCKTWRIMCTISIRKFCCDESHAQLPKRGVCKKCRTSDTLDSRYSSMRNRSSISLTEISLEL